MTAHLPKLFDTPAEARAAGYIPKDQAARILRLSQAQLLKSAREGRAPAPVRVDQSYWFLQADVVAWAIEHPARHKLIGPPRKCAAPGCPRAEAVNGLCGSHYARKRSDGIVHERFVGEPYRGGYWGVVDETEEGILCYECGKRFRHLGTHLPGAHGMSAAEYKDLYGIPRTQSLASTHLQEANRERALRLNLAAGLDGHRDASVGAASRTAGSIESISRTHRQRGLDKEPKI